MLLLPPPLKAHEPPELEKPPRTVELPPEAAPEFRPSQPAVPLPDRDALAAAAQASQASPAPSSSSQGSSSQGGNVAAGAASAPAAAAAAAGIVDHFCKGLSP